MEIYNQYISTKLQNHFLAQEKGHKKTSFWATDCEKPLFDLYHEWIGTPPTNPMTAEKLVMFSAAKMLEVALVKKLQTIGLVKNAETQTKIEMERYGLPVTGYIDAVFVDDTPLEIKTFYGEYQARELRNNKPKTSYLKQLAVYMDALKADRGKLIYMDRGTGEMFEFTLLREKDNKYKMLDIEFNLDETYERWASLYNNNVLPKVEPLSGYRYKYPLEQFIVNASKSDISAARTNRAVYGDWQVKYSPYKNLIIEREGTTLGYSDEELKKIKELTKGYSSKF